MSEQQPKKPKDIKDLKARLGRTIAPNTQKGAAIPAPAVPGVVPPPASSPGGIPAPAIAAPVMPPPSSPGAVPAPMLPGAGVAPPPFMQQQKAASAAAVRRPADPFAAAAPSASVGPQEVRLVIDEKPVSEHEVGRAARGRAFIILGLGILVGVVLGFGGGTVKFNRDLQAGAIADGQDIYGKVRDAEDIVKQAQSHLRHALDKASANPPGVDFESIEALRTLKKPFEAGMFARKRYGAFNPATVDALFEYYNDVNLLWDKFGVLEARTLNQSGRTELTNSALAAGSLATQSFGVLPRRPNADGPIIATLVFVDTPPAPPAGTPPTPRTKATIRASRGGAAAEKNLFTGDEGQNITEHPDDWVMLVDNQSSVNVIGQSASSFADFRHQLLEIKDLMDKTTQIQGTLDQGLSQIAALGG